MAFLNSGRARLLPSRAPFREGEAPAEPRSIPGGRGSCRAALDSGRARLLPSRARFREGEAPAEPRSIPGGRGSCRAALDSGRARLLPSRARFREGEAPAEPRAPFREGEAPAEPRRAQASEVRHSIPKSCEAIEHLEAMYINRLALPGQAAPREYRCGHGSRGNSAEMVRGMRIRSAPTTKSGLRCSRHTPCAVRSPAEPREMVGTTARRITPRPPRPANLAAPPGDWPPYHSFPAPVARGSCPRRRPSSVQASPRPRAGELPAPNTWKP